MSSPFPTSSTPSSGSAQRRPPLPFQRHNGQAVNQVHAEMSDDVPHNYNTAAAQQRLQAPEAAISTATNNGINRDAVCLDVPASDHYPTRLLPNPAKRKRYSLDDVTIQLGKVRVNKASQARINVIPPDEEEGPDHSAAYRRASDWDRHLDDPFTTLPPDLRSSVHEVLVTRTVSQRKASDRILRDLSSTTNPAPSTKPFDIIGAVGSSIDILVLVGKHLRPRDIVNLYSISRTFHSTLDTHMRSSVVVWAAHNCRLAADIFPYQFYVGGTVPDPMGRPRDPAYHDIYARLTATADLPNRLGSSAAADQQTRYIPSLRWLQMVYARSVRVRDILACLARQGHRLPPESDATLLKLWLVTDLPTNIDRCTVIRSTTYFTRFDLYRSAVFLVKLLMRTNDPLYGPDHGVLAELMLGQRGFTPLWKLLRGKGYGTANEIARAKLRYDVHPTVAEREAGLPVLGVPVAEMAVGHLEGWGRGKDHLLRPDELVARECARRGIEMDECVESMAVYGHVDLARGRDLVPELEELYMSDEELPGELDREEDGRRRALVHGGGGNVPFADGEWNPKLVRKARWEQLTAEERKAIEEDDRDEMLRGLVWEEDSRGLSGEASEEESGEEIYEAGVRDAKGKGKQVDCTEEDEEPGVLHDDSVLGGDSEDAEDDISDEEDVGRFYGSRVCSSNIPELQSRVCSSINSLPVMTPPPYEGSPNLVGIHGDQDMMDMDEMDLDDENMDSTFIPSSLTVTPLKFAPSHLEEDSGEEGSSNGDEDGEDSEEELDDEERQRLAAELDEELLAQADEYYSDTELEYDWDAWKEQADVVIKTRDGGDEEDEDDEKEVREYHRLY